MVTIARHYIYGVLTRKSMYGRTYMGIERTTVLIDRTGIRDGSGPR